MPTFSVIMPVYNTAHFVRDAIDSVLAQYENDFELLIVNDCSTDSSLAVCSGYHDKRIRIISHPVNKGLAASRNTGIRAARGRYLAFLDADDIWHPQKLALHATHLAEHPEVGLSFSRSAFIEANGDPCCCYQMPKLEGITAAHLFMRNPVGNGSAPVIRRETLEAIRFNAERDGEMVDCYFDENFRRSEDIECWLRIALLTDWLIAGIGQPLTYYRMNAHGLSANLEQQLASWQALAVKLTNYAPEFAQKHLCHAKAYQLRYLARQAVRLKLGKDALKYWFFGVCEDMRILKEEPGRSLATLAAATTLFVFPWLFIRLEKILMKLWGKGQLRTINQGLQ